MEHRAIQYQLWETAFLPNEAPADPYRDGILRAEITDPEGNVRWRDGFWDGGAWRLRFMPLVAGPHHVRIETNLGGLPESLGVVVSASAEGDHQFPNDLATYGPVRIADDRSRFSRHDGEPFFLKSDTGWYGVTKATDAEWAYYLAKRKAQGFNAVHFMANHWYGFRRNRYGRQSFSIEDGRPDLAAMADLDRRIAMVNALGLVAIPCLLWSSSWHDADHPETSRLNPGIALSEEDAIRIARHMVARWGAHDVMWILAGDGSYHGEVAERWNTIGRGVFGDDADRAPVTMHLCGMDWIDEATWSEPWLDWVAYQSGHGGDAENARWITHGPASEFWRVEPERPLVNIEPPYEGHLSYHGLPHGATSTRRASYWSLFAAPPAGIGYGGHGVWGWDDGTATPEGHNGTGIAPSWRDALEFEGARQIGITDVKLGIFDWPDLLPANDLLEAQPFPDDPFAHVSVLANADRSVIRVYAPKGGKLRFPSLEGEYGVWWTNPRVDKGDFRAPDATAASVFEAPGGEDWILQLDRSG